MSPPRAVCENLLKSCVDLKDPLTGQPHLERMRQMDQKCGWMRG